MRKTKTFIAALAVTATFGLSGCGGSDTSAEPSPRPTATVTATPTPTPSPSPTEDSDLMYGDVVEYLHAHDFTAVVLDEDLDWAIDDSCAAIDGVRLSTPHVQTDRQAWLDALVDADTTKARANQFVDTLHEACYVTGWSERYTKPKVASTIKEGVWTVGVDIQAGTYRSDGDIGYSCYWEITRGGSNGDDIIANDNVKGGHPAVTLSKGQVFKSQDCGSWQKTN